ncbi:Tudor-knot domain-containing protein [Aeromonas veronii]
MITFYCHYHAKNKRLDKCQTSDDKPVD